MKQLPHFEYSRMLRNRYHSMAYPHSHSHYELFYVSKGECLLTIEGTVYPLKKGYMLFILPGMMHSTAYSSYEQTERINIEYNDSFIPDFYKYFGESFLKSHLYNRILKIPAPVINELNTRFDILEQENKIRDRYSAYMKKITFEEILTILLRHNTEFFESNPALPAIMDEQIQKAVDYIITNYMMPLALSDLSDLLHLNPSYFSRKFKMQTGKNFQTFLMEIRIKKSEQLLLETKLSITEIADMCGFENGNYYGDAFRKVNGLSPSSFRKQKGYI